MDKNTFSIQETLAYYRAWNKAERQERLRNAGTKSPEQKWKEYLNLMEFGMAIKPEPSLHEHRQKIAMLNHYYDQIQRFEERRKHQG